MSTLIHPTAVVDPQAHIADDVYIGPFCVVDADVEIGPRTRLASHVMLGRGTRLGADVHVYTSAVIGSDPQDLKYAGEATEVHIGDRTVVREFATVNRGTVASGKTVVGSDVLLMSYVHIAHDCVIGDRCILANAVQLGGHVTIGDWVVIGGVTAVHQFVSIGDHSMVGGARGVTKDIPPYTLASREPLVVEGLNVVGLRRRGFTDQEIDELDEFYRMLYRSGLNITDALAAYEAEHPTVNGHAENCIRFIRSSKRGIVRMYGS